MKKLDLTVCMREKEYGQALARGLAYITPNLDITVCDAGYGNSKMAPGSVIITDDRGLTGENILQLDQILPAGEILEQAACIWHKISGEVFIPETEGTVKNMEGGLMLRRERNDSHKPGNGKTPGGRRRKKDTVP